MKVKPCSISTEYGLQNTLDTMYQLAKAGNEPFYNLIELMLHEQTIMTAIHNIKCNRGSKTKGIDNRTIDHYLQMPYEELVEMLRKCILNYNPLPVKRKHIPKENSDKLRPLGIPAMIDRIIQEITRIVIEPILEAKFYTYSYGFRPMRDAGQAMAEIMDRITRSHTYWVIEGDIKGFFDNINHSKLISVLWNLGIKDKRVLAIIKKMLKSGIIEEDGKLYPSDLGTVQGGILSPLLANAYLNQFDWMIAKKYMEHPRIEQYADQRSGRRSVHQKHERVFMIRYADDWVILCESERNAQRILKEVDKYFRYKLSIELSKEKTLITDIRKKRAKFLGFEFFAEKSRTKDKVVGKMIPNIKKSSSKIAKISKEIRKIGIVKKERDRALQIEKVNSSIVGLANYYSIANCSKFFKAWDQRLHYQCHKTFQRMNGNRGRWKKLTCRANQLNNRVSRHANRNNRLYFYEVDNVKIGITKFAFTESVTALRVAHALTPYTEEGRKLYEKKTSTKLPLLRNGSIYDFEQLSLRIWQMENNPKRKYNFEYVMNREYAYLRDRGKCKCCQVELWENYMCHHIDPTLPLDKVNKVSNLASLCARCHEYIHSTKDPFKDFDKKMATKIMKYRKIILDTRGKVR